MIWIIVIIFAIIILAFIACPYDLGIKLPNVEYISYLVALFAIIISMAVACNSQESNKELSRKVEIIHSDILCIKNEFKQFKELFDDISEDEE